MKNYLRHLHAFAITFKSSFGLLAVAGALTLSLPPTTAAAYTLTQAERADGFVDVWNGKDLSEWHTVYQPDGKVFKAWSVPQEGYLRFRRDPSWTWQRWILFGQNQFRGGGSIATNNRTYKSFHLKLEFMLEETKSNSGVFIFNDESKNGPFWDVSAWGGVEVQIYDDSAGLPMGIAALSPFATKYLTGDIYGYARVPEGTDKGLNPVGQWNKLEVIVRDARYITVITNGNTLLADLDIEAYPELAAATAAKRETGSSFILQDEGRSITYRGIKVKQL